MKENFNKLYLALLISIIAICVFGCTQSYENEKKDEDQKKESKEKNNESENYGEIAAEDFSVINEKIDLGDNQSVNIIETSDSDIAVAIVSNSLELINKFNRMTPVEIYESYRDKKAPESLVKAVKTLNYMPIIDETTEVTISNKLIYSEALDLFNNNYGNDKIVHITNYEGGFTSLSDTYKKEISSSNYMYVVASPCNDWHINYKMERRVIKVGHHYWKTVYECENLMKDQYVCISYSPSNKREVQSTVIPTGIFSSYNHIVGLKK